MHASTLTCSLARNSDADLTSNHPAPEHFFYFAVTAHATSIDWRRKIGSRRSRVGLCEIHVSHGELFERRVETRVKSIAVSDRAAVQAESGTGGGW